MNSDVLKDRDAPWADCVEYLAEATARTASMLPMDARTAFTQLLDATEAMLDDPVERQIVRDSATNYITTLFGSGGPDEILDQNEVREGIFEYFGATLAEKLLHQCPDDVSPILFVSHIKDTVRDRLDSIEDEV